MEELLNFIKDADFSRIVFLVGALMFVVAAIKIKVEKGEISIAPIMRFVLGIIGLFLMSLSFASGRLPPTPTEIVVPVETDEATSIIESAEVESTGETSTVSADKPPLVLPTSKLGSEIVAQGVISIGVRHNGMYPVSFPDGDTYTGFEAELAIEIVKRLFGDQVTISWAPLTAEERFDAVESESVDFLIRNTTHTILREDIVLFSRNYFLDGVRLLVRRSDGYASIEDMDGKTIVAPSEMFASPIRNAASIAGIDVNILIDEDAKNVFLDGRADAVSTYWIGHSFYVDDYSQYQAIGNLLNREPFNIVVSKNNPDFRNEIDQVLLEIIEDGTWQIIYDHWFPEPPPWTIEEMLVEPPPLDILN